jgi:hypothetical protein
MNDFKWDKADVSKAKKIFHATDGDIKAGDFLRKSRFQKSQRSSPITDDFRSLMRLLVQDKSARVTNGVSFSGDYSIRMVSANYPYTSKVFNDVIFSHPVILNPLPSIEELAFFYPHNPNYYAFLWNGREKIWDFHKERARFFGKALYFYQYNGGNSEATFEGKYSCEEVEKYSLEIQYLVSMYKLIQVAKVFPTSVDGSSYQKNSCGLTDHDTVFLTMYQHIVVSSLLATIQPEIQLSNRTKYNCFQQLSQSIIKREPLLPTDRVQRVVGGDVSENPKRYRERHLHHIASGYPLFELLKNSNDPDIKKAFDEWIQKRDQRIHLHSRYLKNSLLD